MKLAIGGMVLTAAWAGNSSGAALEEKWKDGPITIQMEGYAPQLLAVHQAGAHRRGHGPGIEKAFGTRRRDCYPLPGLDSAERSLEQP